MEEQVKILCVDDEQNVLNALKRLFLDDDYEILTASSAGEGIKLLESEHVQIIISDYRMPSVNGVEFLREVYKQWPATVRIVLSGYADASAIVGAINEGQIYKFIPKPWNDDELKVTIGNAIERYFLYKRNRELTEELQRKNETLQGLLDEKTRSLRIRSEILESHQYLLDALPVGVIGMDPNRRLVMCNNMTNKLLGRCMLGYDAEVALPGEFRQLIDLVDKEKRASLQVETQGVRGKLIGTSFGTPDKQGGIILIFVREDD